MYWHKNNNLADTEFVGYTISTQKSSRLNCTVCLLFDVKKSERGQAGICQTENSFSAPMTFSHKPCSVKLNTKYSNWKQCGISLLPEKYNTENITAPQLFLSVPVRPTAPSGHLAQALFWFHSCLCVITANLRSKRGAHMVWA